MPMHATLVLIVCGTAMTLCGLISATSASSQFFLCRFNCFCLAVSFNMLHVGAWNSTLQSSFIELPVNALVSFFLKQLEMMIKIKQKIQKN